MKNFIVLIISSIFSAVTILSCITYFQLWRFENADCRIDPSKHILVVGPSTTTFALDDRIIPGLCNVSQNGAAHYSILPTLKRIIEINPQIDTIWINHGRLQMNRITDDFGPTSSLQYMRTMLLFMMGNDNYDVKSYLRKQPMYYAAILTPDLLNFVRSNFTDYGFGYHDLDGELLVEKKELLFAQREKEMNEMGGESPSKEWIYDHSNLTHVMVTEIISLCKEKRIVPVLFNTPLYQFDRWCSKKGYYDYLCDMDSSILIADYEDFVFPDDTYWKDIVHLNSKGANYFSREIMNNGLKIESIGDWIKSNALQISN